mgnify:CR=1 FL=1
MRLRRKWEWNTAKIWESAPGKGETVNGQVFSDLTQTLALGGLTDGVYNYEMCAAFAAIANGGVYNTPTYIPRSWITTEMFFWKAQENPVRLSKQVQLIC